MDSSPTNGVTMRLLKQSQCEEESEMNNNVIGLDIAKNVFHVYTMTEANKPVKKMLTRKRLLAFFGNYPASLIGI